MYTVQYSPRSKEDLIRIKIYVRDEFEEELATKIMKKIYIKIKKLEEFPLMGRPLSNLIDVPTDYMFLIVERNYVFYRNEDRFVKIICVLNTRRDCMRILFGINELNDK